MDYSVNIYPPDGADAENHDLRLRINAIRKPMSIYQSAVPVLPIAPAQTTPENPSVQAGRQTGLDIPTEPVSWPVMLSGNAPVQQTVDPGSKLSLHDERLPRLYYENFHVAHPILVPSSLYHDHNYPHFLQLAVHFVGSHYIASIPSQPYKEQVIAELKTNPDRSASMVQAWLLYSIALYARDEWAEAQDALSCSIDIALELGMNRWSFASSANPERSLEAESMRRTWWELYVTDIFMAVPLKTTTFRCSTVSPEVALPCEESAYNCAGDIPKPRMMIEFKRRILAAEDTVFSSFSYRIEATTILCRVLVLNRLRDCHRDHLQAVENALVSWINHLPPKKLDIVDSYGNVDEMMFQAHLTIAYAAMLLHLPRSDLPSVLSQSQPDDRFWPGLTGQLSSTFTRLVHSIKATDASRRISDSISVCPNVSKHTPFIIPALTLCGLIQLATSTSHSEECFDHHCNRVTLILGCLKSTQRTWKLAESLYHALRSSAAEVLSDSMEKWNAEPVPRFHSSTTTPNDHEGHSSSTNPALVLPDGHDFMPPEFSPQFIDPTCYNASFFSAIPDFDIH
ncbi:Transcription factor, fungi [Penicillium italicum]|uniref:Transcription factor, fungi n=1 Tax=Penicillium italicum TaxID=40296 RepID=A0A0A2LM77_PENIT|nr:Transcription factor, fungi [Penicillium italicum]